MDEWVGEWLAVSAARELRPGRSEGDVGDHADRLDAPTVQPPELGRARVVKDHGAGEHGTQSGPRRARRRAPQDRGASAVVKCRGEELGGAARPLIDEDEDVAVVHRLSLNRRHRFGLAVVFEPEQRHRFVEEQPRDALERADPAARVSAEVEHQARHGAQRLEGPLELPAARWVKVGQRDVRRGQIEPRGDDVGGQKAETGTAHTLVVEQKPQRKAVPLQAIDAADPDMGGPVGRSDHQVGKRPRAARMGRGRRGDPLALLKGPGGRLPVDFEEYVARSQTAALDPGRDAGDDRQPLGGFQHCRGRNRAGEGDLGGADQAGMALVQAREQVGGGEVVARGVMHPAGNGQEPLQKDVVLLGRGEVVTLLGQGTGELRGQGQPDLGIAQRARTRRLAAGQKERKQHDGRRAKPVRRELHETHFTRTTLDVGPMSHWHDSTAELRAELRDLLDTGRVRELHRTSGLRHALIAARQFALLALCGAAIVNFTAPWIWIPAAIVLGFVVFSFSVLLHEVVHRAVFENRDRKVGNRVLAWLYAVPSGLAPSQFTRWHLDHHAELGTDDKDPKRHHLTPKIIRRWFKLLYLTPALFPIYFRAAAREAAGYEPEFRARLRRERIAVLGFHAAVMAAIWFTWGSPMLLRLYVVPLFFVFPIAFTVNRLGQHYDIEPDDPAAWGTIIKTNPIWNFLYLWSNYHMEHHYFPGVPFYNLAALHKELKPVLDRHPMRVRTYGGLLWDWFVRNKAPHVNWH